MDGAVVKAVEDIYQDEVFWAEQRALFQERLAPVIRKLYLEGARAAESVGVLVDFDGVHRHALAATRIIETPWWGQLEDTTRQGLREALIAWQETGLGRRGLPDLIDAIGPLFEPERVKRIAVTESTRVFAEGNIRAAKEDPLTGGLQWQTARDERVCKICGEATLTNPLGRADKIYPTGQTPECPAHPNCRCALVPVSWDYIREHRNLWQGGHIPNNTVGAML